MRGLILVAALLCAFVSERVSAQSSWSTSGNSNTTPGTQFIGTIDAKDVVFKVQNIERGRIINNGGGWRFGNSTNYAKVDGGGKLTFGGTGVYQVAANKYVYQYTASPNIGLYYNASSTAHEFRDNNGAVAASVSALSGNGYFKGNLGIGTSTPSYKLDVSGTARVTGALRVGSYTLPTTAGTAGQVLTSNGTGSVTWTTPMGGTGSTSQWASNGTSISYNTGNVGVGITTPAYKLHIAGTGYFSDALKVGAYTLPITDGTAGQVLTTNGAGAVAWTSVSTSGGTNPWVISGSNISYSGGNAGLGTTSPAYKLDVAGTGRFTGALKVGAYTLPATDGTAGQVLSTNGTGAINWITPSAGNGTPSQWTTSGSNIYYTTGNVGVGTNDLATGYRLSVSGKIMCEEVKVQLAANWPDYVFQKDYSLLPLEDLATSIERHKHLPGIPSAKEVEAEGLSVGDMQVKMMEKIEELTLYLIDANKEMNTANAHISSLQNNITQLQQRIKQLEKRGN